MSGGRPFTEGPSLILRVEMNPEVMVARRMGGKGFTIPLEIC